MTEYKDGTSDCFSQSLDCEILLVTVEIGFSLDLTSELLGMP